MRAGLPGPPQRVFVDTSAFYGFITPSDSNYEPALSIMRSLSLHQVQLTTTNFVRVETHALILNRLGRWHAIRFLDRLEQGSFQIVRVTPSDEERASLIVRRYEDKTFSLTDATSFAVMDRLHIRTAFAFDENFEQYGLSVLTP